MPISKIPVGAIATGTIGTSQIADNAVTTAKILNDNVTSAKIPNDAIGSTEIAASAVTRDELQSAAVNNISSDSIILNSTNGTADAGDFLVLDGTDGAGANANHRILFDDTFVDKIGLFNINTLGAGGTALKVNSSGTGFEFGSAGGLVLLNTTDITSATATIAFDNTLITDTYGKYILEYHGLKPVNDGVFFRTRYSADNGNSFLTGTFNYGYHYSRLGTGSTGGNAATPSNYAESSFGIGNDANHQLAGTLHISGMRDSNSYLAIEEHQIIEQSNDSDFVNHDGWYFENTSVINYIEFSFSGGNIADGTFSLYGLAK